MNDQSLLGIFDSGVGGFSVYKQIRKVTDANCIYYGDCLRAPYGNREESEIVSFIRDDIRFLQDEGVTHFVNACNSMSVITTDILLNECSIEPENYTDMVRAFSRHTTFGPHNTVLLLATNATIRSGAYQEILATQKVSTYTYAFKDLAFAIENNLTREVLLALIEPAILYAKDINATHIVLGCTHYPLISSLFSLTKEKLGWSGEFVDPAVYVAQEMKLWGLQGERKFLPYSSKDTAVFIKHVAQLFR